MLGRHNVTIYADEAERCIGGIRQLMSTREMDFSEQCYWTGVLFTLEKLLSTSLPDDYKAFIAAMQLHFTGELPGEIVELKEGE